MRSDRKGEVHIVLLIIDGLIGRTKHTTPSSRQIQVVLPMLSPWRRYQQEIAALESPGPPRTGNEACRISPKHVQLRQERHMDDACRKHAWGFIGLVARSGHQPVTQTNSVRKVEVSYIPPLGHFQSSPVSRLIQACWYSFRITSCPVSA